MGKIRIARTNFNKKSLAGQGQTQRSRVHVSFQDPGLHMFWGEHIEGGWVVSSLGKGALKLTWEYSRLMGISQCSRVLTCDNINVLN